MLEQVRSLSVNLERILVVEEVGIESLLRHDGIVLQTVTQKSKVCVRRAPDGHDLTAIIGAFFTLDGASQMALALTVPTRSFVAESPRHESSSSART
jgi:hypothetical protein